MNTRQRWLGSILFGEVDKPHFDPGQGRESTWQRWYQEGLPKDKKGDAIIEYAYRQAGGKEPWPSSGPGFYMNERLMPPFEEKIIDKKERTQIVQDWKGNICEISNEFELRHLRDAIDFVTRRWIKCPVESRKDWTDMKRRYNPNEPSRLPKNTEELGQKLKNRDYPLQIHIPGPFWQSREWLGFENLCIMIHDDKKFVEEMIEFWCEYISQLLKRTFQYYIPDGVHISEDMAYKGFSMISPRACRELLMPCWKKWGQIIRDAEVPVYAVDSDGYIGELIPLWIESGINCCDPIEVAAGNDINQYRKDFGKNMAYRGGVDKRSIAAGGTAIEKEIERIKPVIDSGGYIPGCDHGVPSDVSWPNFVYYTKLLAKATGWIK